MDKLTKQAIMLKSQLYSAGAVFESGIIDSLMQQRAELLEALKRIKAASSANAYCNVEWIAHHANEAITKAEAV